MYRLKNTFLRGVYWGGGAFCCLVFLLCAYLHRSGKKHSEEKLIRDLEIVDDKTLTSILRKKSREQGTSGITFAGFALPKNFDTTHTLIIGSSGSGKSVLCSEMISNIRNKNRRAIIYDVSGTFLKHFYRPDKDVILNPLDARSACWDIWQDCTQPTHFQSMAEALIPDERGNSDFFVMAARSVLASVAEQISLEEKPCLETLTELLLVADFPTLLQRVSGTKAASILNKEGGRTAASVRAVISANIQSFSYLFGEGKPFSIRQWVADDASDGFIFITSNAEQQTLLRPLITLWADIATSAIMGLEPNYERRIYVLLDELASLNRLPMLRPFLSQGRKYGGCAVLCTQSYSQMLSIFGAHETKAIAAGCSNWAVLRCNDIDSAEWLSRSLCQQESVEKSEGLSYGAHEVRDSVSLQEQRRERPLVSATELIKLPDLAGYLRLGRGLPLARFESQFVTYPVVTASFVARPCKPQPHLPLPESNIPGPLDQLDGGEAEDKRSGIRSLI